MARQIKWLDKTAKKMPPNRHLPSGKLLFGPNRSTVSGAPLTRFALSSNKKERKKETGKTAGYKADNESEYAIDLKAMGTASNFRRANCKKIQLVKVTG